MKTFVLAAVSKTCRMILPYGSTTRRVVGRRAHSVRLLRMNGSDWRSHPFGRSAAAWPFLMWLLVIWFSFTASAQQTTFQDSLLDRFTGSWVLHGTIQGKETTHDVAAQWVLGHQYLQFHEVSLEKDSTGNPMYEATVFIGWDQPLNQYACFWLDGTSGIGLSNPVMGHAKRERDKISLLFKFSETTLFHTTFLYNRASDTWQWMMDDDENGKLQPFARVKLTRK